MFIAFEGLESSGKSTQAARLARHLEAAGWPVERVAEPGTTDLGAGVRQLLLHREIPICGLAELLLYEAARAQLTRERIRPALNAGRVVIADRYSLSSVAYQGYGRGLDLDRLKALDAWATDGLRPDLTVFFDITFEQMRARQQAPARGRAVSLDRLEKEDRAFFNRVRDGYLAETAALPGAHRLDGSVSEDAVFEALLGFVGPLLDDP